MYIAPSSGEPKPNLNLPFNGFKGGSRLFSDVWSENAALYKRLMKIHSNLRQIPSYLPLPLTLYP